MVFPSANLQVCAQKFAEPPATPPSVRQASNAKQPKQVLQLSEVKSDINNTDATKSVDAKPLSIERLKELAALLPPMKKIDTEKRFEPVSYIKHAPPATKIIEQEFPPKNSGNQLIDKPDKVKSVPLKVSRVSLKDAISSTDSLRITFNQPMVAVGAPETSDAVVPVVLSPKPPGVWHWFGTETIEFQPNAKSFPNATTFKIEVPAGTSCVNGAKLASAYTSSFSTPRPKVESLNLGKDGASESANTLSPVITVRFNQAIDQAKTFKFISGKVSGKPLSLRLATASEIKQNEDEPKSDYEKSLCVILKPTENLPKNAEVSVMVSPGIPSLEGPDAGKERQVFAFKTYEPLRLSLENKPIQTIWTVTPTSLRFNNQLDQSICKSSMFTVVPAVKNFKVKIDENGAVFNGDFKLGVNYTIRISDGLRDCYGQLLSGAHVVRYQVQPRPPQVFHPTDKFGQLVPSAKPVYHIFTYNEPSVKVSILQANLADWKKFEEAHDNFSTDKKAISKSLSTLKVLFTQNYSTGGHLEKWNDIPVDLKPYFKDGNTHLIAVVEAPESKEDRAQRFTQWIEYSPNRINVFNDSKSLYTMVTDIRTGKAVSGAELTLLPSGVKQRSDEDGLTKFALVNDKQEMIQCNFDGKVTFLPHDGPWQHMSQNGEFEVYQKTDRNLYRPGETVRVNGLIRWTDWLKDGELVALPNATELSYLVTSRSNSAELAAGTTKSDKNGAFSFAFNIPKDVELGDAFIELKHKGAFVDTDNFQIQEFRRPEFEVTLDSDKSSMILGDVAAISAKGIYRTGSSMPHSKIHWHAKSHGAEFSAADFNNYIFSDSNRENDDDTQSNDAEISLDGISDAGGIDSVRLKCSQLAVVQPVDLIIDATTQDLNRQEWTKRTSLRVHPAGVYTGLKLSKPDAKVNDQVEVNFVVTDTEGKIQPDYMVHLAAVQYEQNVSTHKWTEKIIQELDAPSAQLATSCTFNFKEPGDYAITAKVTDHQGRINRSRVAVQVISEEEAAERAKPDSEETAAQKVILKANKQTFAPSENAEISIQAPFVSGHGILLAKGDLIVSAVPFEIVNRAATISLPITALCYPQVKTEAFVFGPNNATASGELAISVPTDPMNLSVTADSQNNSYQPGQSVTLKIGLKDAKGNAFSGGQVALAVVDESILALTNYEWNNPLSVFYYEGYYRGDKIFSSKLINAYELKPEYLLPVAKSDVASIPQPSALPPPPLPAEAAVGGFAPAPPPPPPKAAPAPTGLVGGPVQPKYGQSDDSGSAGSNSGGVKLRSDLNPLAYYNPVILTGADGTATVTFKLPGNLTKYKVMAVAMKGVGQFGAGNSIFTASLPLMVRPSIPRFLNYNDKCELPFVVENTTDKPVSAELIVRANNLNEPGSEKSTVSTDSYLNGRSFQIPANDRVEIRLPVVASSSGIADIQVAAFAAGASDASELSIPLQAPVTAESFATYGQIDEGSVAQRIMVPKNVISKVGGLEITTSSTAMQQLFDAVEYLKSYPFSCSEQLSSQLLGMAALGDLIAQFKSGAVDAKASDVIELQTADVAELCKRQRSDGGFGLWVRDENEKYPFVSIQCARALFECSKRKISVPQRTLDLCKSYLKSIESHFSNVLNSAEKTSLAAYALNVRFQNSDADPAKAKKVVADAVTALKAKSAKFSKNNVYHANHSKNDADDANHSRNVADGANHSKNDADDANHLSLQELLPRAMSLESMAWLLPVLNADGKKNGAEINAIENIISEKIDETSSTASIDENPYGERSYLMYYSPSRLNAVALEALISTQPSNTVIPKMVKGLLQQRRNGRWLTTQENACSLLALSKYFSVYEKAVPDFAAQFWLGEAISFEQKFVGRDLSSNELNIPMEYLQTHLQDEILTVAKKGAGRLYYRVGMKCAPSDLKLPATSRGFTVERTYTAVDSAADVSRDASGLLHVKSGGTLKVTVKIIAPGMRYHVAMVDPFPAGFEALNPDTVGTRQVSDQSDDDDLPPDVDRLHKFWHHSWFDHQNLRDNQAEAFTTLLNSGEVEYTYFVRATTPGTFTVPPCKVEEMYAPETFGRTATEVVVIK